MRFVLWVGCVLVFFAGFQLFILSERTADYFAWTINPPLTAAFFGAFYWTALVLAFLSARKHDWASARIGVAGVFLFVTLTLITTLMHADRFHFDSDKTSAAIAAWTWLAIYIIDPLLVLGFGVLQLRTPGVDPPRSAPLAQWFRAAMSMQGAIVLVLGIALFVVPTRADDLWPWTLSPLTARAAASWLIGMGVILLQATWENDWERVEAGLNSYIVLGVLQLIALARYSDTLDWGTAQSWGYLAFVIAVLATSVYGSLAARRAPHRNAMFAGPPPAPAG
jgi:hypothetical protein